jgi:hypothetical protein
MKTKIGKKYKNIKTDSISIVVDIRESTNKSGNFIYYVDVAPREFEPNYTMSLPEHTFLKKYTETK